MIQLAFGKLIKWPRHSVTRNRNAAESVATSQELNKSYGYLWWNNTTNKWPGVLADALAALGKWDNNILVVPSLDLIVIRQSDLAPDDGHKIAAYFQMACEAVEKP